MCSLPCQGFIEHSQPDVDSFPFPPLDRVSSFICLGKSDSKSAGLGKSGRISPKSDVLRVMRMKIPSSTTAPTITLKREIAKCVKINPPLLLIPSFLALEAAMHVSKGSESFANEVKV